MGIFAIAHVQPVLSRCQPLRQRRVHASNANQKSVREVSIQLHYAIIALIMSGDPSTPVVALSTATSEPSTSLLAPRQVYIRHNGIDMQNRPYLPYGPCLARP